MNTFNTAIYEPRDGELLVVWGGRRINTLCLVPPLCEMEDDLLNDFLGGLLQEEAVWVRRYRVDATTLILTHIFDDYKKRKDYLLWLGRNPAIHKDTYGRIIIAFRVPIISSQDPFGALSSAYVVPRNIGTTAGMNYWKILNSYDFSEFEKGNKINNFEASEQVEVPLEFFSLIIKESLEEIEGEMGEYSDFLNKEIEKTEALNKEEKEMISGLFYGGESVMFSEITEHFLTNEIMVRGMGGNNIDLKDIKRWRWNEEEGLGNKWSSCVIDEIGRQLRSMGNILCASISDKWEDYRAIKILKGLYSFTSNCRIDRFGKIYFSGYSQLNKSIPYQVEDSDDIITEKLTEEKEKEFEEVWAIYNEKEKVIEEANIPSPTEVLDKEAEEQEKRNLAYYYYDLPTKYKQRPGFCIADNGLMFLSWLHGNTTFIEKEKDKYIAVGLRIAVSRDNGKTFEPLLSERVNFMVK